MTLKVYVLTISHAKLVSQYVVGLTPLTRWRCFAPETLSPIRNRTKEAGMDDIAKMTAIAIKTSIHDDSLTCQKNMTCQIRHVSQKYDR